MESPIAMAMAIYMGSRSMEINKSHTISFRLAIGRGRGTQSKEIKLIPVSEYEFNKDQVNLSKLVNYELQKRRTVDEQLRILG
jgi:hypothetical protein